MDYIIDELFTKGFRPETRKETSFIDELKDDGFVYFDKQSNLFKMKEGIKKTETTDDITLSVISKINYIGLFPNVDNYTSSLMPVRNKHIMIEFLGNTENAIDKVAVILKGLKLGQVFSLTALGYGKNSTNEGYKLEVPEELEGLMYKGNRVCYMTTGLEKNGKEKDTKLIDFVGVRPTKTLFRLGISTSFGVFYDLGEFEKAGKTKVIDKALLK